MSKYEYKVDDYVEYIGDVPPFYGVKGQITRVYDGGTVELRHKEVFYNFLPTEIQITDPPATRTMTDAEYTEALADAWDEGYTACRTRPSIDGYRINRTNPYMEQ